MRQEHYATGWNQLVDLFLIELTNWRWCWRSMLITGTLAPLLSTLALGVFARDSGRETLAYVLTGNMVISLMFGNMDNVQSHFVFMRFQGALDYYATLPIRKHNLILAVVLSFLLLSAPSLILTMGVGAFILALPIRFHPLLLAIIPACALSLSAIGALIGTSVRSRYEAGAISLIVTMVMAGLGPVVVPASRLPRFLVWLGWINPATYASSAMRQTVVGPVTGRLAWDMAMLLAFTILVFAAVLQTLDWRQN